MSEYIKYGKTYHFAWSEGVQNDDKIQFDLSYLEGKEVVGTEKMDGENCVSADTIVHTNMGKMTIKDVCNFKGDIQIYCYNEIESQIELKPIINKIISDNTTDDEWYEILTEDGETIRLTEIV